MIIIVPIHRLPPINRRRGGRVTRPIAGANYVVVVCGKNIKAAIVMVDNHIAKRCASVRTRRVNVMRRTKLKPRIPIYRLIRIRNFIRIAHGGIRHEHRRHFGNRRTVNGEIVDLERSDNVRTVRNNSDALRRAVHVAFRNRIRNRKRADAASRDISGHVAGFVCHLQPHRKRRTSRENSSRNVEHVAFFQVEPAQQ